MIRLLLRLFKIRDFEVCASCETLKQQLEYERAEKKELTATLLNIIKPKEFEAVPVEINQIQQTSSLFSKRRAALEEKSRLEAQVLANSKHIGKSDKEIEKLESELGIETEVG